MIDYGFNLIDATGKTCLNISPAPLSRPRVIEEVSDRVGT